MIGRTTIVALCALSGLAACDTGPACDDPDGCEPDPCAAHGGVCPDPLKINELMPKNDGAWIDNELEADDWLEIVNAGDTPISTLGYSIADSESSFHLIPAATLEPGEVLLLWADGTPSQGADHFSFKLSAAGETLYLWAADGRLVDCVTYPAMTPNQSYARIPHGEGELGLCFWATPGTPNGDTCGPPPATELPVIAVFEPFLWPQPWPATPSPLAINELVLRPADFIEVVNTSAEVVDLTTYLLGVAHHAPGLPWPAPADGVVLTWPVTSLAPGERIAVTVVEADVATISADADYEGVATLWFEDAPSPPSVIDRVDFMAWPDNSALARLPDTTGPLAHCDGATPAADNATCVTLSSRDVPDRLRHLRTPGDFVALSEGGVAVGMEAVKIVTDMDAGDQAGDVVHLLSSVAWDLHYTFVREEIDHEIHLDRCDPTEAQIFRTGWGQFSMEQYFQVETRRYLLGTMIHHAGADLWTIEYTTGDQISPEQISRGFFGSAGVTLEPELWSLRPQSTSQIDRMREIEGQVPIIGPNAPYRDVTFQPLSEGVAFGVLRFVPVGQLFSETLGRQTVVITDEVPNDIPMVGGLITEAFQTPLAHVNVLSRNRGTPNMALRDAREDPQLEPLLDTLVRFEVTTGSFEIREATPAEAEAFWESFVTGDPLVPRLDTTVRGLVPLEGLDLAALPYIGAKAAGLAELAAVWSNRTDCPGPVNMPLAPAAIPMVHSLEHYEASGAADLLAAAVLDPAFTADPRVRADKLAEVQAAVLAHPVDSELLAEVEAYATNQFGYARVRFRSSSNTEDLPGFNGAGLYTSQSGAIDDAERPIAGAILTVWASLFNARAYDERLLFNVDQSQVAMGVLIHPAFLSEEANAVAISRNIFDPIRSDQYFINSQMGEASVTNPAPGVTTEQGIYRWGRSPRVVYHGLSSLPDSQPVMSMGEMDEIACTLRAIHEHYRPLHDPDQENAWFAMDIELKLVDGTRDLLVKQARPYTFGSAARPTDCREF